jgi:hypothetical protein
MRSGRMALHHADAVSVDVSLWCGPLTHCPREEFPHVDNGRDPCGRDTRWVRMLAESHREPGKHCRTGRYLFDLTQWMRPDSRCDASCAGPSRRGADSHWSPRADKRPGRHPTTAVRDGRWKPLARRGFNRLHVVVVIVKHCCGAGLCSRQRCLSFASDTALATCWKARADAEFLAVRCQKVLSS